MRIILRIGFIGIGLAIACLLYGFFVEPKRLVVRDVAVSSKYWSGAPIRIGLMSDLHVGGRGVDAARAREVVAALNAGNADLVLLAGDFINGHHKKADRSTEENADIAAGLKALGQIKAPMGTFAVIGNHDYLYGRHFVDQALEAIDIPVLDNRHITLSGRACLFGTDDDTFGTPTMDGYVACPPDLPKIGLMHSPDVFYNVPSGVALTLAGHTHGGQIVLPFIGRQTPTHSGKATAYGAVTVNDNPGFVTAGIGMSILPARFRAPPEIVFITLSAESR